MVAHKAFYPDGEQAQRRANDAGKESFEPECGLLSPQECLDEIE